MLDNVWRDQGHVFMHGVSYSAKNVKLILSPLCISKEMHSKMCVNYVCT